eukprot:jgi/Tetstr1/425337/TSEL_015786.t1
MMAGGKKAGGFSSDQPTEKFPDKTPEPVQQTTAEATLSTLQTLKLHFDSLSTRLDIQKEINEQRANVATNDDEDECGNDPSHDARAASTTEDEDGDDCGEFIDPRDWVDDLYPALIMPSSLPLGVRCSSLFKPRRDEADLYFTGANKTAYQDEYRHVL